MIKKIAKYIKFDFKVMKKCGVFSALKCQGHLMVTLNCAQSRKCATCPDH